MSLTLGDNFSYQGAKPLDARLKYDTVAAMKAVADATMYEGCLAYCSGTDKTYQWKSGNTVDETTGKWREFSSGGGGGSSYSAGDGIDITNDEISTEKSQEGWLQEVIEQYPASGELVSIVNAFNQGDLYSTTERMVGQWIDGKPVYQKTFSGTVESKTNFTSHDLGVTGGIDTIVNISGIMDNNKPLIAVSNDAFTASIAFYIYPNDFSDSSKRNKYECFAKPDANQVYVGHTFVFHLQYTKASDSAISIGDANEYSTDEKIVGSWIDGKPLYQKTIAITSGMPSSGGRTEFSHNIENVDYIVSQRARIIYPESMVGMECDSIYIDQPDSLSNTQIAMVAVNTTKIILKNTKTLANTELYVTLQYTKLS